ncbi:uncharacterized protein LOC122859212 [Aphidius gifuensis]|uniref:uncharacterized protein LOC122859212 n=1 Tax=Aphidius gifuensis TaxID=684658 RepID=UPI001CDCD295|nr:uncharacterized protein LOC122859212 [Aphidius gifuensis]
MRSIINIYLSVTGYLTEKKQETMDERTRLIGNPVFINIDDKSDFKNDLMGNYEYLTAHPLWIKIRLIIFWILWIALIVIIIITVVIKSCLFSNICSSSFNNKMTK